QQRGRVGGGNLQQSSIAAHRRRTSVVAPHFAPLVEQDGSQPAAETALPVINEVGQLPDQKGEDLLNQIRRVGVLQTQTAGPVEEQRSVQIDEASPRLLIDRTLQLLQQAGRSCMHGPWGSRR